MHIGFKIRILYGMVMNMEKTQMLGMPNVGLGNLTEYQLLVLFGNYHSLSLVEGTDLTPNSIVDANERLLYPAYYMTHIQVPVNHFIENYTLWEQAKVSVDVKCFGANLLDSHYTFEACNKEDKAGKEPIVMDSNSLFVVDATIDKSVNRTSAIPKPEQIAKLEKMKKVPDSLKKFKSIRNEGFQLNEGTLLGNYKFQYLIVENRDVSINHGVIFAKFTEIMDMCESEFLCDGKNIGLPKELIPFIHIVDRETFYYSNCFAGDTIECDMTISLEKCEERHLTGKKNEFTVYWMHETFELYNEKARNLLLLAKAKKLICLPITARELEEDISRIIHRK